MGVNKIEIKFKESSFSTFTEGYWASDQDPIKDEYKGKYSWPKASSFPEKEIFLKKLIIIEEHLLKLEKNTKNEDYVQSYRGLSHCRICDKRNGYKEYVLTISETQKVNWPEGFRHYVEAHDIRPSDKFFEYIMDFETS